MPTSPRLPSSVSSSPACETVDRTGSAALNRTAVSNLSPPVLSELVETRARCLCEAVPTTGDSLDDKRGSGIGEGTTLGQRGTDSSSPYLAANLPAPAPVPLHLDEHKRAVTALFAQV